MMMQECNVKVYFPSLPCFKYWAKYETYDDHDYENEGNLKIIMMKILINIMTLSRIVDIRVCQRRPPVAPLA